MNRIELGPNEYSKGLLNILEDFTAERDRLRDTERAVLNVLEDAAVERGLLHQTQNAVLNILDDAAAEKTQLQATQRAVLNILDDAAAEQRRLHDMQKAVLNILDDLGIEKSQLERVRLDLIQSERAIRASLHEKEILLKEIHHRVKNNLQVISSLLNLQIYYVPDPQARAVFAESQGRIHSIALVHEKLYQSKDLSHINFQEYVMALVKGLCHTQNADRRGVTAKIDAEGIQLSIDAAIPCGLIVHELVTNALKHAFPEGRRGTVEIRLSETNDDLIEMVVCDDGVGIPEEINPRKTTSLGLDLVFTFAEQIEAKVEIQRQPGTSFRFLFPGERTPKHSLDRRARPEGVA